MSGKHGVTVEHMFFDDYQRAKINTGQCKTMLELKLSAFGRTPNDLRQNPKAQNAQPVAKGTAMHEYDMLKTSTSCPTKQLTTSSTFWDTSDKATGDALYVFGHRQILPIVFLLVTALGSALATNSRRDRLHSFAFCCFFCRVSCF